MGDYIGDKKKKSGPASSGGDTKQFTAIKNSSSGASSKSALSGSKKSTSSKSSSSGGQRSSSAKASSSSGQRSSSSKSSSAKSSGTRSSSGTSTSKSAYGSKSTSGQKSSSGKSSSASGRSKSAQSSAKNSSGAKSSSSSRSSSGTKSAAGSKSSSSFSSQSSSAKRQTSGTQKKKSSAAAYSESLEKKRNSSYERELHSSERANEIKKARKRRNYNRYRKLFNFMFYAAIFVAVTAVIVIMSVTVLFGIENIVVEMNDDVPYTSAQIVSGCDVREGQNLFIAPVSEAGEQIMTNLPYIETCTVERRLPSTVIITVSGAKAVGVIIDETGQRFIVSTGMRALEAIVSAGDAPEIPVIEGVVVSATSVGSVVTSKDISYLEAAIEIVRILDEQGIQLDSISFSSGGNITAMYDGRINLVLGTATGLENKLLLAAMLINDGKITKHESGDLNLSIDGRAIFTPDYVKEQYSDRGEE